MNDNGNGQVPVNDTRHRPERMKRRAFQQAAAHTMDVQAFAIHKQSEFLADLSARLDTLGQTHVAAIEGLQQQIDLLRKEQPQTVLDKLRWLFR